MGKPDDHKETRADLGAAADRRYSVDVLVRISEPVLQNLALGHLKKEMPVHDWEQDRAAYTHLEALGRTIAGIAPWLELGADESAEGQIRERLTELSLQAISQGTDPLSPDFMNFTEGGQPLVDVAFLAHGLLRAPNQLWGRMNEPSRHGVLRAVESVRAVKPHDSNWLLFSAMAEAALWQFAGACKLEPIEYAVERHMEWYLGDGTYGDGPNFHWDYYNSFVIQPMLLDVLRVCARMKHKLGDLLPTAMARARRYAAVQERLISPEGTFPVIGRSSAYRFGALQHLSAMALHHELPSDLPPGAVRSALTAVVRRMADAPGTFDADGWLRVGVVGHQPSVRESYISTGSLYLCLTGLLHLGLPPDDAFWTAPEESWTQKRVWSGRDFQNMGAHLE